MRRHLTKWLWFQDRLCCLSARCLVPICLVCAAALVFIGVRLQQFLDDLAFLLADNDIPAAVVLLGVLLISAASLWLLACCAAALARRLMLYLRGL